jgi:signal peptidase
MKIIITITKTLLAIVSFILLPTIIFLLITSHSGLIFGIRTFTVLTGSMVPTIPINSSIITIPSTQYNVGDVITFKREPLTVTHRIYAIKDGNFITKGDANKIADAQPVNKMMIIGKDVLILPSLGKFLNFVKTFPGILIFIVLPILLYISFEIRNIIKEVEKRTEIRVRQQYETAQTNQN